MRIQLASLFGMLFYSHHCWATSCGVHVLRSAQVSQIELAQIRTRELLELQKSGFIKETVIFRHPERQDIINVKGVPKSMQLIEHNGDIVFRHYSENNLDLILVSKTLKSGNRPFIDADDLKKLNYLD